MAADLVDLRVAVILAAPGTPPALAAKTATATIPIVFANVGDPVGQGLVASLARPGGNLTGISILFPELTPKRIELLAELVPEAKVIGLIVNPANPTNEATIGDCRNRCAREGAASQHVQNAGNENEIDTAFTAFVQSRAGALVVGRRPVILQPRRDRLVALASRHAVPAIYAWREFVAERRPDQLRREYRRPCIAKPASTSEKS